MTHVKSGSPFLYDDDTGDVVGVKDSDGGESIFLGGNNATSRTAHAAEHAAMGNVVTAETNPVTGGVRFIADGRSLASAFDVALTAGATQAVADANFALLQAAVDIAKSGPVRIDLAPGTYYLPSDYIDVEGVESLELVALGKVVLRRIAANAAVPYFSNPTSSAIGFGRITATGPIEFHGHWNRPLGFRANFGADVNFAGAAFRLYGIAGDELRVIDGPRFMGLKDLPIVVYGGDLLDVHGCYFERCRDIGAVDVRQVRGYHNTILFSEDNGISASRGCGDVHLHHNVVIGANSGLWVSKYTTSEAESLSPRRLRVHDNTLICCMTGIHCDGAPKDFGHHDNTILWTGFHTTGDNETGYGAGTHLDTTIAADATKDSYTLVLADASKLVAGEYFLVHPSKRASPRIYKAQAVVGNAVTTTEPLDEAYTAAHEIRITKCEVPASGITGYPIMIQGAGSLMAERGQVHSNTIHGWTGKAAIWADRLRMGRIGGNQISKPLGLVAGDGAIRGIYMTDGGASATRSENLVADDNIIDMTGVIDGFKKKGVEYTYSGTILRGGPVSPKGNRIRGVLRGNESIIPTPTLAPPPNQFFDEFNESVSAAFVDPSIPSAGKLILLDFGNSTTLDVGSSIANGQSLTDITGTTSGATVAVSGGTARHLVDQRCLELVASGANSAYINLGADLGLNSTTNRQFLVIVWVKALTLINASSNEGTAFLSLSSGAAGRALQMRTYDSGPGTSGPMSFWWDNRALSPQPSSLGSSVIYTVHQYAMSYTQSGANSTVVAYRDGVAEGGPHTVADVAFFNASSTIRVGAGCAVGSTDAQSFKVYRLHFEDLAASGRTPLDIVAADYAANRGRFV